MDGKIGTFLNSNLGILLLGFVLTTVAGSIINFSFQDSEWKREKSFEIFSDRLNRHSELIDDLDKLMHNRAFKVKRVLWALEYSIEEEPDLERIKKTWEDYYESAVIAWNEKLKINRRKIEYFAGAAMVAKFYTEAEYKKYDDLNDRDHPKTITGYFGLIHNIALTTRRRIEKPDKAIRRRIDLGDADIKDLKAAFNLLEELEQLIEKYILELDEKLTDRAKEMEWRVSAPRRSPR